MEKKNKNKKKTDMDWAFYIKMDQAQYLRKDPKKAKQITFRKFKEDPAWPAHCQELGYIQVTGSSEANWVF